MVTVTVPKMLPVSLKDDPLIRDYSGVLTGIVSGRQTFPIINYLLIKYSYEPEEFDMTQTARVRVGLGCFTGSDVVEVRTGEPVQVVDGTVDISDGPGEWKMLKLSDQYIRKADISGGDRPRRKTHRLNLKK